jgi:hypothetical protein
MDREKDFLITEKVVDMQKNSAIMSIMVPYNGKKEDHHEST